MTNDYDLSKEEIKEIISESGYLEEQKVANEFENNGFFAGTNFSFMDQDTEKSREVDFIATKYTDFTFGRTGFYLNVYGEVKKRTEPLIFFDRLPHKEQPLEVFIPIVSTQEFFSNIEVGLNIKRVINMSENHHQTLYNSVSTQFCVIDPKKKNKKAEHKDLYESLFIPLLKCLDTEVEQYRKHFSQFDISQPSFFFHLFQPVIVISGPLYSYDVYSDQIVEKDYIIYRRHYNSNTVNRTVLIDIVTKKYLSKYIKEKLMFTYRSIEMKLQREVENIIDLCIRDKQILYEKIKNQGYQL